MKQIFVLITLLLLFSISCTDSNPIDNEEFMHCLSTQFSAYTKNIESIFTQNSSLYTHLLESTIQNPRWLNATTPKPLLILTPFHESEIQAAIFCSKKFDLQIRVRSGGHDYEGLSYLCPTPFIILDMMNFRSVEVDIESETAWVQSGATIGEVYYAIARRSDVHGFPAGICPTVGMGGHLSGGGFGTLVRKYGLAADNVVDAYMIDVNGRILDRESMGEDLFWAIRGGGGGSFGVILSWKIKLVKVPKTVTGFTVSKTIQQGATKLIHKWQTIVSNLHEDLFIRIIIQNVNQRFSNQTVEASFNSLFLGDIETLIPLMNKSFPELGLTAEDCTEMSWIQSTMSFAGFQDLSPSEVLLDKRQVFPGASKAKSDFVTKPIPINVLEGAWKRFMKEEMVWMIFEPFGGKMNKISDSESPFPHRNGVLFNIQYIVKWEGTGTKASNKHIKWIRSLYKYMTPYVSNSPRGAYVNYRDLDLGTNKHHHTSYLEAAGSYGVNYFKGNFKRLAMVKRQIDPHNFFKHEQSIPPM